MKTYIWVFIFLCISCIGSVNDSILDLGGGYFYLNEGGDLNKIFFSERGKQYIDKEILFNGIKDVEFNENYILIKREISKDIIRDSIKRSLKNIYRFVKIKNDTNLLNKSVFKKRKYIKNDSIVFQNLINNGYKHKNTLKDIEIIENISDSILKKLRVINKGKLYYIVSKQRMITYGGYDELRFLKKKEELKISKKLSKNFF